MPAIQALQVHKLYMVGLVYPGCLNGPSPVRPEWHITNLDPTRRNVRTIHRHIGLVLRYDDALKVAVILLGTSGPRHPHRFLPWYGTRRLDYQPREVLHPDPQGAFLDFPGYLNFTHAIRVLVIQENEAVFMTTPGLSYAVETTLGGDAMDISVSLGQVQLLHTLHALYWEGKRYSVDGFLGPDDEGHHSDDDMEQGIHMGLPTLSEVAFPAVSEVANPIHVASGMTFSSRVAQMLHEEDVRATQMEMLDEEEDLADMPTPAIHGIFEPLRAEILGLF